MEPTGRSSPQRIEDRAELSKARRAAESSSNGLERVRRAHRVASHAHAVEIDAILFARRQRFSWADIAEVLGVSKQAVIQRYGRGGRYDVEAMGNEHDASTG